MGARGLSVAEPRGARILLVDDDDEMRSFLRRALGIHGYPVVDQSSAAQVVATLDAETFDAVILDKEMPGVNGLDLLRALRDRHPELPVIFVTAFGGPRLGEEVLRMGAARYLEKPFRVGDLLEALRQVTSAA
jgi:DNA-binding response OmpR family regulator